MTIEVQLNAYAILQNASGQSVSGRFLGVDKNGHSVLSASDGVAFVDPDLWKCTHFHNQPKEADDSFAWIATRKQIARAMTIERKRRSEPV